MVTTPTDYLTIRPIASTDPSETHASLVVSQVSFSNNVVFQGQVRTDEQLRTGSEPNPWECAWLVWNYTDNDHFYYLALKPNGWELGKRDPAYVGGQRFLATGSDATATVGEWDDFRIEQHGATITVWINGVAVVTFTDQETPYTSGRIGLYTEDAEVSLANVTGSLADDFSTYQEAQLSDGADLGSTWDVAFLGYGAGWVEHIVDDFLGDTSTAAQLALNGSITGSIEQQQDRDWFRVSLTGGSAVVVSVLGLTSLSDTCLRIYDVLGNLLWQDDSSPGPDSQFVLPPSLSGTYYVEVGAHDNSSFGIYSVSLANAFTGGDDNVTAGAPGGVWMALRGNDTVAGTSGDDTIDGGAGNDMLAGNGGRDALFGADGADRMLGGAGDDLMFGQADNDILWGDAGRDGIDGGDGGDTIICGDGDDGVYGGNGNDAVAGQTGNDVLLGDGADDILFGGAGADIAAGGTGSDILWGDDLEPDSIAGNDSLNGGEGNDIMLGQGGNDTMLGGTGSDAIAGGDGSDVVYGEAGADILFGGNGGDVLIGGAGGDVLKGEAGGDLFIFGAGDGGDIILDFNAGGVRDGIDFRPYFDAIGYTGITPRAAGLMQVTQNGADTDIYLQGTFMLRLQNVTATTIDDSYFLFQ